ncbi:MAG: transcription-repair coupling factor [Pseudomonadaceae bacterium]|nr:transcription-repair coupling factor [Pseudomonadaceae bacterium]
MFKKHLKQVSREKPLRLQGLPQAAWPWLAAETAAAGTGPLLVIAPDPAEVEGLAEAIGALTEKRVDVLPLPDVAPYDRLSAAPQVQAQRAQVLRAAQEGVLEIVVSSIPALALRLPAEVAEPVKLHRGIWLDLDTLGRNLVALGYKRVEQVHGSGEWARRGGVVDVWPAAELPLRLEFFGDELERLDAFDPDSQRSLQAVEGDVLLGQGSEVVLDEARIGTFRANYREMFDGGVNDTAYAQVSEGVLPAHATQLLPLFWDTPLPLLTELLPDTARVLFPADAAEQAALWEDTVAGAYAARREAEGEGEDIIRALPPELLVAPAAELLRGLAAFPQITAAAFDDGGEGVCTGLRGHDFLGLKTNRHAAAQAAARDVAAKAGEGYLVVLTAVSAAGLNQMLKALESEGAPPASLAQTLRDALAGKEGVAATVAPLAAGWVDPHGKVMVLTEGDVFGQRMGHGRQGPRRRKKADELIAHFSQLREGDYVVHEDHGIGRFVGLVTLTVDGLRQDMLKLLYAGDDRLFVPVENLDVLSRYKGADGAAVQVDKLGGSGWQARKAKVREDLMAMADELLATAAARTTTPRAPLLEDGGGGGEGLYAEFCAGFPYQLTEDQQRVMEEVESDFAEHHPMDRLVVGDVGFGKTEVALRAAFLAAAAGKQVAVVCPTTLLARQHYDNFLQRFAGFPMRVGRLSRLVGAAESKTVKDGLADGTVDIVVGTHALLGKGIKFRNLGLVVIDEEQRFGVAHKERLKQLRAEVDILTLTATPIPRTLQMAVGGVRQLSLITTPPMDRQAVATFVLPWDNKTIAEALKRELTRGGQAYVVAPHIEDLPALADSLHALLPDLRLGIAHGQMPEGELEDVMGAFYEGKLSVLLATTIIESGLDVPRANTLIVYRADRFGLAQLYQLRGRVGRSSKRAFAYFVLPEGNLTGEAAKRLTILQRLTDLGAGFMLASYDMDLRGFGNLLGKQQSGNIRDIGFELYNKMLREAVAERRSKSQVQRSKGGDVESAMPTGGSVSLKLGVSYLIPESFMPDENQRLQMYRRIATLEDAEGLEDMRAELSDRYGQLPAEVESLLAVMRLKRRAEALNISKLEVGEKGVLVAFGGGRFANPQGLMKHIMAHAGVIAVRQEKDGGQSLIWHRRFAEGRVLDGVGTIVGEVESCL